MSPQLLGTLIGAVIGLLLALAVALPHLTQGQTLNAKYPDPDWRGFCKSVSPLICFLVLLHWAPDLAAWLHERILGRVIYINVRKYDVLFVVGYALAMTPITVGSLGNAWSTWHRRRAA